MCAVHTYPFFIHYILSQLNQFEFYSHTFNGFLLGVFLSITVINTVINKHFGGVLGGVGNNSNIIIMYLFFYAGTRFFKGRISFLLPLLS